jgi:uncharacterized SAM-binding protein YcdF (DUF218 family)
LTNAAGFHKLKGMSPFLKKIGRVLKVYLIVGGVVLHLFLLWMWAGWPIYFDRILVRSQKPEPAEYIVCIGGGLGGNNLPTEDGWQRVYTAVQLYFDGWAPKVVFSGGGAEKVTEAEIYAETAEWFGCPPEAIIFEPGATSTADQPAFLLKVKNADIRKDTPLLVVTTPLHSKRVALCFEKAGFTAFRMVTGYRASKVTDPSKVRDLKETKFAEHRPSGKSYADFFNRLKWRSAYFWTSLRELGALIVYKIKGYA